MNLLYKLPFNRFLLDYNKTKQTIKVNIPEENVIIELKMTRESIIEFFILQTKALNDYITIPLQQKSFSVLEEDNVIIFKTTCVIENKFNTFECNLTVSQTHIEIKTPLFQKKISSLFFATSI